MSKDDGALDFGFEEDDFENNDPADKLTEDTSDNSTTKEAFDEPEDEQADLTDGKNKGSDNKSGNPETEEDEPFGKPEDDEKKGDDEDDEIELNLSKKADQKLVDKVIDSYNQGLLEVDKEDLAKFDGTRASYEKLMQVESRNRNTKVAENIVSQLPPRGRDFIEYLLQGGKDIEGFLELEREGVDLSKIDTAKLTDSQAKDIVVKAAITKGEDADVAEALAESLADKGKLVAQAKKIVESQSAQNEKLKNERIAQAAKDSEARALRDKEVQTAFYKEVAASKLRNSEKHRIFNDVYAPDSSGNTPILNKLKQIFSNPKHLMTLAMALSDYDPKDGLKFSMIRGSVATEETVKTRMKIKDAGKNKSNPISTSDGGDGSFIVG